MPLVEYLNYEVLDDHGWELDDDDLFEKAGAADLDETDYGFFEVDEGEYILNAAESSGHEWPFSCRKGICSNCAAVLLGGSVEMDGNQALNDDEVEERNVRLTCISRPTSDTVRLVFNAKNLEYLQDRIMYYVVCVAGYYRGSLLCNRRRFGDLGRPWRFVQGGPGRR
jgi:ferredoxin